MELGVVLSGVMELGDVNPEVVELGVAVSEVVELGDAKPEGVDLGVAVSEVVELDDAGLTPSSSMQQLRTHSEVEVGNDGAARLVYTPSSSSSSESVGVEPAVTRSWQQGGLGSN